MIPKLKVAIFVLIVSPTMAWLELTSWDTAIAAMYFIPFGMLLLWLAERWEI